MLDNTLPAGKQAQLRERVRRQIVDELAAAKIYDSSTSEIDTEVSRRVEDILKRRAESGQMEIEFPDRDELQNSRISKREANVQSRDERIKLREKIVELLEVAGSKGLSREEIADKLGKRPSDVCSPVLHLIRIGEADQPRRQPSRRGSTEAVVVLRKFVSDGGEA